jgi:hypothetical protein
MRIYGCEFQATKVTKATVTLTNVVTGTEMKMTREEYEDRLTW